MFEAHRDFQRWLQERFCGEKVVIPFAPKLADRFPAHRVESRRLFPQVLAVIEASCVLHFKHREQSEKGLVATSADYEIARRVLSGPLLESLRPTGAEGKTYQALLKTFTGGKEFSRNDAVQVLSLLTESTAKVHFPKLLEAGLIETTGKVCRAEQYRIVDPASLALPEIERGDQKGGTVKKLDRLLRR